MESGACTSLFFTHHKTGTVMAVDLGNHLHYDVDPNQEFKVLRGHEDDYLEWVTNTPPTSPLTHFRRNVGCYRI